MNKHHPYELLTPELVIDAVESTGRLSDLRIFPLNSYENRVYQVGIEDSEPVIIKFYRPERWTRSEEHTSELQSRQYIVCRLLLEKKNQQCII